MPALLLDPHIDLFGDSKDVVDFDSKLSDGAVSARAFSAVNAVSRRISLGSRPPYFFFQLK